MLGAKSRGKKEELEPNRPLTHPLLFVPEAGTFFPACWGWTGKGGMMMPTESKGLWEVGTVARLYMCVVMSPAFTLGLSLKGLPHLV